MVNESRPAEVAATARPTVSDRVQSERAQGSVPSCGRRLRRAAGVAALAATALLAMTACAAGGTTAGGGGDASCAAVLDFDGRRYVGDGLIGEGSVLKEGRRLGTGVQPGCDDGNGAAESLESVVHVLPGVDPRVAVLTTGDRLWIAEETGAAAVREDGVLREVRRPAQCALDRPLTLTGDWIGVTQRARVRFDGDLRPPARMQVVVAAPSPVVGPRFAAQALTVTIPQGIDVPPAEDVVAMVQGSVPVEVTVTCDRGRFVARSVARG